MSLPSLRGAVLAAVTLALAGCSTTGVAPSSARPLVSSVPSVAPSADASLLGTLDVGPGPCAVETTDDGRVFATIYSAHTVVEIDPASGNVRQVAEVDGSPCGLTWADDSLWVSLINGHTLLRLDPDTGEQQASLDLDGDGWDVQTDGTSVWVADRGLAGVLRIDAKTGKVAASVKTDGQPTGLAMLDGHAWVALQTAHQVARLSADGTRIDFRTDAGQLPTWFGSDDQALWVTDRAGSALRLDPADGSLLATVQLGGTPRDPTVAFGAAWVANGADGVLSRIDLVTNEVSGTVQLKPGIFAVEPVGDEIWVENYAGSQIYRIDPDAVHS
jgi:streptogramin lyase